MKFLFRQIYLFLRKQSEAALFGGILLFFISLTYFIKFNFINRYDLLFIFAILTQIFLFYFKFEKLREILVIFIFHILALFMEVYKVNIGSWTYFGGGVLSISGVPIFTGFMYSAIGSYIYRAWKINKFSFKNYPKPLPLIFLAAIIYINFFTNHFIYDFRYFILILSFIIFYRTKFFVEITDKVIQIHPLISNALMAFVIWLSEQFATLFRVWAYPNQMSGWVAVSFSKYISWYLLLILSFIIISLFDYKKLNK